MKLVFKILIFNFLFVSCVANKQNRIEEIPKENTFIPYTSGSYWVYKSDETGDTDTLKIIGHENSAEGLKVSFNSGEKWLIKGSGDSIYTRCSSIRVPENFKPLYIRIDSGRYKTCNSLKELDVSVSKIENPITVKGKIFENCRFYQIGSGDKIVVCDGIGIVRHIYTYPNGDVSDTQILIDYKIINH